MPIYEFEFFLAEKLNRTRTELLATISTRELWHWNLYYQRQQQKEEHEIRRAKGRGG